MVEDIVRTAREAARAAPEVGSARYAGFATGVRSGLHERWPAIRKANQADVDRARDRGMPSSVLGRLELLDRHLDQLDALVGEVLAALPGLTVSPGLAGSGKPLGMSVRRVPRPLGVILFVYEARPTVTIEGALLTICTGNAVLLRGGSEMSATSQAFGALLRDCLAAAGLPSSMAIVLDDPDRKQLRTLLACRDDIDLLIPRGSPSLIGYCRDTSAIPMVASGGGVNHLYVHAAADPGQAAAIALDSKLGEPTACNTVEMILADRPAAADLVAALSECAARTGPGCTLRLPGELAGTLTDRSADGVLVERLAPHDAGREFLDRTVGVTVVADVDEATAYIREYGSGHTEGIVSPDPVVIDRFCRSVDAAAIVINGSLRLHDGPTMRLGPEISISTGRLHVRGPAGMSSLLTYSWIIDGRGSLRGGYEVT